MTAKTGYPGLTRNTVWEHYRGGRYRVLDVLPPEPASTLARGVQTTRQLATLKAAIDVPVEVIRVHRANSSRRWLIEPGEHIVRGTHYVLYQPIDLRGDTPDFCVRAVTGDQGWTASITRSPGIVVPRFWLVTHNAAQACDSAVSAP